MTDEPTKEQYAAMVEFIDRVSRELVGMTEEMRVRVLTALPILTSCTDEVRRRLP